MFVLQSVPWAVAFCVVTMLCWGSWANTQKLAGKRWRFELYYWDYVFGVLLMLTLRFSRNGLIAPLIAYFERGHVAAETVAKRAVASEDPERPS